MGKFKWSCQLEYLFERGTAEILDGACDGFGVFDCVFVGRYDLYVYDAEGGESEEEDGEEGWDA